MACPGVSLFVLRKNEAPTTAGPGRDLNSSSYVTCLSLGCVLSINLMGLRLTKETSLCPEASRSCSLKWEELPCVLAVPSRHGLGAWT